MPRCSQCGKSVPDKADLMLVRTPDGRWLTQCRRCVQPVAGAAAPEAAQPGAAQPGAVSPERLSLDWLQNQFTRIRQVLDALNAQAAEKKPARTHTRAHERRSVDLGIRFACERDDSYSPAILKDISRGGMRFVTERALQPGQMLRFDVSPQAIGDNATLGMLQSAGEVRRVLPLAEGSAEIGVRFVKRMVISGENRRRFKRLSVDLAAFVRRPGSELTEAGMALDLSQGGMRLQLGSALAQGEELEVVLRGETGAFAKADLWGRVKVVRSVAGRHGLCEAGCQLLEVRMNPRGAARISHG